MQHNPPQPTPRLSDADRTILHALLNPGIGIGVLLQDTGLSFADFADWCSRPDIKSYLAVIADINLLRARVLLADRAC
ncbi:MAG: hypothetical protein IT433_05215, partial [Phycisphaerales bacterium]|nr:hypothetical protein [Phycisphaerales bacterium]